MRVVRWSSPWPWLPWLLPAWLLACATVVAADRADDASSPRRPAPSEIRHRQPAVRAEGFRKLADYQPMEAAKLLVQLGLADRESEVRRAARETLRGLDLSGEVGQALLKSLEKRLRGPPDAATALLIAAILENDAPMLQAELTNLLVKSLAKSKSCVPLLVTAADTLGEEKGPKALDPLKRLTRLPGYWEVFALRRATVQAVVHLDRPDAAEFLIELLSTLKGEVRGDVVRYLLRLKGKAQDAQEDGWDKFWVKHREGLAIPGELPMPAPAAKAAGPGKAAGKTPEKPDKPEKAPQRPLLDLALGNAASYYGMSIHARRLVFVIDISGSMNGPRITAAKRELCTAVSRLPEDAEFNILAFSDKVTPWQRNLLRANSWAKQSAIYFVNQLNAGGRTAAYDALEAAMRLDVEAIYFLTDGHPNVGRLIAPAEIVAAMRVANHFRRVSIYSIGIAPGPPDSPLDAFLRTLTEGNYGEYRRVDQ